MSRKQPNKAGHAKNVYHGGNHLVTGTSQLKPGGGLGSMWQKKWSIWWDQQKGNWKTVQVTSSPRRYPPTHEATTSWMKTREVVRVL